MSAEALICIKDIEKVALLHCLWKLAWQNNKWPSFFCFVTAGQQLESQSMIRDLCSRALYVDVSQDTLDITPFLAANTQEGKPYVTRQMVIDQIEILPRSTNMIGLNGHNSTLFKAKKPSKSNKKTKAKASSKVADIAPKPRADFFKPSLSAMK
jgi:hypothetical protein